VDAIRGVAVFIWLLSEIAVPALYCLPPNSITEAIAAQLSPSFWQGATARDLLLPTFCFVAGLSIVPAFHRRKAAGQSTRDLVLRILRRVSLLTAIGLICEGDLFEHWPSLRFVGAFQRIAVCYAIAACLELTAGWRVQAGLLAFLLLDYWAILALTAAGSAAFSFEGNAAAVVDQLILPGRKYFGTWDPDGILTTIPAVAVTIAGLLAGKWLNAERLRGTDGTLRLIGLGVAAFNVAFLWDFVLPINPYLWTPSFCLVAIGTALVLLGGFHAILDVRRSLTWAVPLIALGRNALLVVVVTVLLRRAVVALAFVVPLVQTFVPEGSASPACGILTAFLVVAAALWLNRRGAYVTV
jgi:predicted acyltransferase